MRIRTEGARPGLRPGMTLIELLISMVLLSLVMGTILSVVTRQQRFYRVASELMETRGQLRSATSILPVELRGVSTQVRDVTGAIVGSDILAMGPNMIEFRSSFGAGVVCEVAGSTVTLYPDVLASSGLRLGGFLYEPAEGDVMFLLNNGEGGTVDDSWDQGVITAPPTTSTGCAAGLAGGTAADLALPRRVFTLTPAPTAGIVVGAPVRVSRTVKYELYQDATSGLWYLGQNVKNEETGAYIGREPVAGPYLAGTADPATSGLYLRYLDIAGNVIVATDAAARQSVTQVDVIVRGETTSDARGSGFGEGNKQVLQSITVAIRNRT